MKNITTTFKKFLNESNSNIHSELFDFIKSNNIDFEYWHIFTDKIKSYHGRIEDGLIVLFYLKEFFKYYNVDDLRSIKNWKSFIDKINDMWNIRKTSSSQKIVFRRGDNRGNPFFSDNINVASVYSGSLNAYIVDFTKPFIIDCEYSDWNNIKEPVIMKGESFDGIVDTDNIVEFIKDTLEYNGIVFKNLHEGSGAEVFGASNVYVSLNNKNVINITNN